MNRSDQIRNGIVAARERGIEWGRAGKIRAAENAAAADEFANSLRQLMAEIMSRTRFPSSIAVRLNLMGVPTARGGFWRPTTVYRLIDRLGDIEKEIAAAKATNACSSWWRTMITFQEWRLLRGITEF
jgi:hypothetical protein